MTGDRSKVQCCKEQYCIETWNVSSINQGNLEVVKQEIARVNVNIREVSELKWTGMGEFNSDDPLYLQLWAGIRRNGVVIMVNKDSEMQYLDTISKAPYDLCSFPRETIQYHSDPSLCPN